MDLFVDFLVNLLASAAWAFLAILATLILLPRYRSWSLRKFWGFAEDEVTIVVAATPSIDCEHRKQTDKCYWSVEHGPIIGYGDANALGHVMTMLKSMGKSLNISLALSTAIGPDFRERNLIMIGGPAYNPLVKELLDMGSSPVLFEGYSAIEKQGTNTTYHMPLIDKGVIRRDYGILVKMPNPFNRKKTVFVIAGCHDPGSIAAARYAMTDLFHIKRRPGYFALVVESDVLSDFYITSPRLVSKIHTVSS